MPEFARTDTMARSQAHIRKHGLPGAPHQLLASLEGDWDLAGDYHAGGRSSPRSLHGTMRGHHIQNNLFMQLSLSFTNGQASGGALIELGFGSFDQQYRLVMMESGAPGAINLLGDWSPGSRAFQFEGHTFSMALQRTVPCRLRISFPDSLVMELEFTSGAGTGECEQVRFRAQRRQVLGAGGPCTA